MDRSVTERRLPESVIPFKNASFRTSAIRALTYPWRFAISFAPVFCRLVKASARIRALTPVSALISTRTPGDAPSLWTAFAAASSACTAWSIPLSMVLPAWVYEGGALAGMPTTALPAAAEQPAGRNPIAVALAISDENLATGRSMSQPPPSVIPAGGPRRYASPFREIDLSERIMTESAVICQKLGARPDPDG